MNDAKTESGFSNSSAGNLNALENLLNIHLYNINLKQVSSEIDSLYEHICKTEDTQQFGIVIAVDAEQSIVKKIRSLLYTAIKARQLKIKLAKVTGDTLHSYGVYPLINKPMAVYQLKSPAEVYANKYVLPPIKNGLNGFLRRIIFSAIKFHPSTAGIILILNKTT